MRELLARMRVGSPNNKIQLKTPRTNMEINSNLSAECSDFTVEIRVAKIFQSEVLAVRVRIF